MSQQKAERDPTTNIDQTIAFLKNAFERSTRTLGYKNHKGTKLYDFQCEFMWLLHEITNGPIFSVPHFIQEANNLLKDIENYKRKKEVPDNK